MNDEDLEVEDLERLVQEVSRLTATSETPGARTILVRILAWLGGQSRCKPCPRRASQLASAVRAGLLGSSAVEWLARLSARYEDLADPAGLLLDMLSEVGRPGYGVLDEELAQLVSIGGDGNAARSCLRLVGARSHEPDWSMVQGQEVWPSSRALARLVVSGDVAVSGHRVLELGCGLGLVGLSCALAGAESVVLTDRDGDLLKAVEASAQLNGVAARVGTGVLDWDCTAQGLAQLQRSSQHLFDDERVPPFDLVLGADIVYEEAHAAKLLAALHHLLTERLAVHAVLATGMPESRDGVASLCDLLGTSAELLKAGHGKEGTLSLCAEGSPRRCISGHEHADGHAHASPHATPCAWRATMLPDVRSGRPHLLFRFTLAKTGQDAQL